MPDHRPQQRCCAACGLPLRLPWRHPLVTVAGWRYHRICYVLREAPSANAAAGRN